MSVISWLASYPKSGNTWLRVFLGNLLAKNNHSALKNIEKAPIASCRSLLDEAIGYDSSYLTNEEINKLRPEVEQYWANQETHWKFRKVHDAYTYSDDGKPMISDSTLNGAIYIVRNPLDICISLAYHLGHKDIDKSIQQMADPNFSLASSNKNYNKQLPQQLSTWSEHVRSWINTKEINVHIIRYEDMQAFPVSTFKKAAHFCGLNASTKEIEQAVKKSQFSALQEEEQSEGFNEQVNSSAFFRSGRSGNWKSVLSDFQINKMIENHYDVMSHFGYIDESMHY
ncbi:sulfotransferase domain-containing protein [Pleionea sp. CnH1-48]|uniref:sulfotransferase domain-containing protein n=1 Tax=Pleionea sp. CnH1-48 TaxID=2954494 RepID=UPI00209751C7|nr:sulfotransferase domain-containing protein [Pleionea sp. CnH1-48]